MEPGQGELREGAPSHWQQCQPGPALLTAQESGIFHILFFPLLDILVPSSIALPSC